MPRIALLAIGDALALQATIGVRSRGRTPPLTEVTHDIP